MLGCESETTASTVLVCQVKVVLPACTVLVCQVKVACTVLEGPVIETLMALTPAGSKQADSESA